jgi:hypothetical protein
MSLRTLTLIGTIGGKITPQRSKIAVTPKRLKKQPCGLVSLPETVWTTKWPLQRLILHFLYAKMAAQNRK